MIGFYSHFTRWTKNSDIVVFSSQQFYFKSENILWILNRYNYIYWYLDNVQIVSKYVFHNTEENYLAMMQSFLLIHLHVRVIGLWIGHLIWSATEIVCCRLTVSLVFHNKKTARKIILNARKRCLDKVARKGDVIVSRKITEVQ